MHVQSLWLSHFRNYETLEMRFHPGINIILGENAQGKTNLLEALYLCATLRSFRTRKDSDFIRFEQPYGYLKMAMENQEQEQDLEMVFRPDQKKRVRKNGLSQGKISDVIGTFRAVLFSPEDLRIVRDSPEQRRYFMDSELIQASPRYYYHLVHYHRILKQRNALLKNGNLAEEELAVWDGQLAASAAPLFELRYRFLEEIGSLSAQIHSALTKKREHLTLHYLPGMSVTKDLETKSGNSLEETVYCLLEKGRQQDLHRQTSLQGPHRDDIRFRINQMDVRQYGSQGQKRTVVLSLKLAVLEWIHQKIGEYPVLLLDDVTSELDEKRQRDLMTYVQPVQTVITSTHPLPILHEKTGKVFHISQGTLHSQDTNGSLPKTP